MEGERPYLVTGGQKENAFTWVGNSLAPAIVVGGDKKVETNITINLQLRINDGASVPTMPGFIKSWTWATHDLYFSSKPTKPFTLQYGELVQDLPANDKTLTCLSVGYPSYCTGHTHFKAASTISRRHRMRGASSKGIDQRRTLPFVVVSR